MYVGMSKNLRTRHMQYARDGSHIREFFEAALAHGNVVWRRFITLDSELRAQQEEARLCFWKGSRRLPVQAPKLQDNFHLAGWQALQGDSQGPVYLRLSHHNALQMLCQTVLDYPWNRSQNPYATRIVYTTKTGGLLGGNKVSEHLWKSRRREPAVQQ